MKISRLILEGASDCFLFWGGNLSVLAVAIIASGCASDRSSDADHLFDDSAPKAESNPTDADTADLFESGGEPRDTLASRGTDTAMRDAGGTTPDGDTGPDPETDSSTDGVGFGADRDADTGADPDTTDEMPRESDSEAALSDETASDEDVDENIDEPSTNEETNLDKSETASICTFLCVRDEGECVWGYHGIIIPEEDCEAPDQICCDTMPNGEDFSPDETDGSEDDTEDQSIVAGSICATFPSYNSDANVEIKPIDETLDHITTCGFAVDMNTNQLAEVLTGDGMYVGTVSAADNLNLAGCGACVEVARMDSNAKVVVTLVDYCTEETDPACTAGYLSLSEAAFVQISEPNTEEESRELSNGAVAWRFVDCPVGATTVRLRFTRSPEANDYRLLVRDARYPIAAVTANGHLLERDGNNTFGSLDAGPQYLEIRDINGAVIRMMTTPASSDVDTLQQFPTCRPR